MTIVVGVDGSAAAQQALLWAIAEGRVRGGKVRAVLVWDLPMSLGAAGPLLGGPGFGELDLDSSELQRSAEARLTELVAEIAGSASVERHAVQGHTAEVLVQQAIGADLLVVGSHGHGGLAGALLGSVSHACAQHATCPVVIVRAPGMAGGSAGDRGWHPDEVIAREVAQNKQTWEALQRLGVAEGAKLRLEFVYETGGEVGDQQLAEYLRREKSYDVVVEGAGVSGSTAPTPVGPQALDEWVAWMVIAGHDNGGCAFDGWTATVSTGPD